MKKNRLSTYRTRPGSLLIDAVLGLFVVGFMIILVGTFVSARETNRRALFRTQAAALADEQLNTLRRLDVTALSNQTNGTFINTLYNAGSWQVVPDAGVGHSAPNVLELAKNSISNAVSGRMLLPAGTYTDATIEARWLLSADSPANASIGYLFRSNDSANGYRLRFARTATDLDPTTGGTQNVYLEKLISGTATRIDSRTTTIAVDTWYSIRIVTNGSNTSIYLNGTQLGSGPFIDTTYTDGAAALLGWNGAHALVDDVQIIANATENWDFDADTVVPAAWVRLGLNDLPDSTTTTFDDNGLLTISTWPVGSNTTTLKQASITIRWLTNGGLVSYTTSGLLGRSGVGL